jgi:hypothetical protein
MHVVLEMHIVGMTWQLNPEIALFPDLAATDLPLLRVTSHDSLKGRSAPIPGLSFLWFVMEQICPPCCGQMHLIISIDGAHVPNNNTTMNRNHH